MRSMLRQFRRRLSRFHKRFSLWVCQLFFACFFPLRKHVYLSYEDNHTVDGLGAQVQRILAIRSLAVFLNLKYIHQGIKDLSVHPLDGISSKNDYDELLTEVNYVFSFQSDIVPVSILEISVRNLTWHRLIRYALMGISRHGVMLKVVNPYALVDGKSDLYNLAREDELLNRLGEFLPSAKHEVCLHHRRGTGRFSIQPGQSVSRELPLAAFLKPLTHIKLLESMKSVTVNVFTDAPKQSLKFQPSPEQRVNWVGLPDFDGQTLSVQAQDIEFFFRSQGFSVEVHRGGNPLYSLALLANSNFLVASKSSFSYVAALLNPHAKVFIPKDFWHTPLNHWELY